ncbi:MAG: NADH-quinone oxidoreductase subunit F, partial [Candidatus Heimdallarchaeota archaeon]
MTDFDTMVKNAKKTWDALHTQKKPVIYAGAASCGRAAGVMPVIEQLQELNAEIPLKIVEVGCIGPCYLEPIIAVQKKGSPTIFYGNVQPVQAQ